MLHKDKIKLKIQALLAKTETNGASEAEALNALKKAQELMKQYFITENELTDPFLGEECILEKVEMPKTGYKMTLGISELGKLFDCESYYVSKSYVAFYGFSTDVNLCTYFYKLITKACINEVEKYKESEEYSMEKAYGIHGKTLVASFIKGFLIRVARKVADLYKDKQSNIPTSQGLIVVEKEKRVTKAFANLGMKLTTTRDKVNVNNSFRNGYDKGNSFEITQGVEQYNKENTLNLSI